MPGAFAKFFINTFLSSSFQADTFPAAVLGIFPHCHFIKYFFLLLCHAIETSSSGSTCDVSLLEFIKFKQGISQILGVNM